MSADLLKKYLADLFAYVTMPYYYFYYLWLVAFVVIGTVILMFRGAGFNPLNLLKMLFPKNLFVHQTTVADLKIFFANTLVHTLIGFFLFSITITQFGTQLSNQLGTGFGGLIDWKNPWFAPTPFTYIAFGIAVLLAEDFGRFFDHFLQHKIKFLWRFHEVHHSTDILTPLSVSRVHPLERYTALFSRMVMVGLVIIVFNRLFGLKFNFGTLSIQFAVSKVWMVLANFRHSHIWISYGPLQYLFISPAQHQIHHSCEDRHIDKNFGGIFAVWDLLFGSLYVPKGKEEFRLGLRDKPAAEFNNMSYLLKPFFWPNRRAPVPVALPEEKQLVSARS